MPQFADPIQGEAQCRGEDGIMGLEEVSTVSPLDIVALLESSPSISAPATPPPAPPTADASGKKGNSASSTHAPFDEKNEVSPTVVTPPPTPVPAPRRGDLTDAVLAHFRETYDRYLAARQDCDESIEGITYEHFCRTLTKNRNRILQQHPSDEVQFTVLMKGGRASVKAKRNIRRHAKSAIRNAQRT